MTETPDAIAARVLKCHPSCGYVVDRGPNLSSGVEHHVECQRKVFGPAVVAALIEYGNAKVEECANVVEDDITMGEHEAREAIRVNVLALKVPTP